MAQSNYPTNDPQKGAEYNYGNPPPMGGVMLSSLFGIPGPVQREPSMREYRNRALTQPFRLRERIRAGRPIVGFGALLGGIETSM